MFALQDLDVEDDVHLKEVDYQTLEPYCKMEAEKKKLGEDAKAQILFDQKGFSREGGEGDGY